MKADEPKYAGVQSIDGLEAEDGIPLATPIPVGTFKATDTTDAKADSYENEGITVTWEKGEVQPSKFRDRGFAIAFILHLIALLGSGATFGPAALKNLTSDLESSSTSNYQDNGQDYDWGNSEDGSTDKSEDFPKDFWIAVVTIALVSSPILSFFALTVMSRNTILLIKASLWFSVALNIIAAALLFATAQPIGGIFFAILAVCLTWYARSVQNRIPYAASNLRMGITVVKSNLGLGFVALASMVGLLVYSFVWLWSLFGTMSLDVMKDDTDYSYSDSGNESGLSGLGGFVGFLFVLSFYWTHQVAKNIVRSTVSGVVGTFWFSPDEASSFCSAAVGHSFIRSTTYSLGSICFGSFIVALLHMLRNSLRRAQRSGGILRCIAHCILAYIEALVEYFNKWAYIYVGLYGYGYIDAGKKVASLFKTRGWQTIIADNLVNRLLGIMSLTIGLLAGVCTLCAAFVVEEFESAQGWMGMGFIVGFFAGLLFSGVFMGLLSSAVDAIIVCYAEAPNELQENHPAIAQEMHQTWSEAWGNVCGPVIVGLGGGLGIV